MRRLIFVGVAVLSVAGCAHPVWVKPGATQQDYATDTYECERDARMSGYYGSGVVGLVNFEQFQDRCMVARGWRQVEAGSPPPPPSTQSSTTFAPYLKR